MHLKLTSLGGFFKIRDRDHTNKVGWEAKEGKICLVIREHSRMDVVLNI